MIMHEHMDCYFTSLKFFFVLLFLPGIWAKIQGEQVTAFISLLLYCIPAVISQLTTRCVFHLHASPKSVQGGLCKHLCRVCTKYLKLNATERDDWNNRQPGGVFPDAGVDAGGGLCQFKTAAVNDNNGCS